MLKLVGNHGMTADQRFSSGEEQINIGMHACMHGR